MQCNAEESAAESAAESQAESQAGELAKCSSENGDSG